MVVVGSRGKAFAVAMFVWIACSTQGVLQDAGEPQVTAVVPRPVANQECVLLCAGKNLRQDGKKTVAHFNGKELNTEVITKNLLVVTIPAEISTVGTHTLNVSVGDGQTGDIIIVVPPQPSLVDQILSASEQGMVSIINCAYVEVQREQAALVATPPNQEKEALQQFKRVTDAILHAARKSLKSSARAFKRIIQGHVEAGTISQTEADIAIPAVEHHRQVADKDLSGAVEISQDTGKQDEQLDLGVVILPKPSSSKEGRKEEVVAVKNKMMPVLNQATKTAGKKGIKAQPDNKSEVDDSNATDLSFKVNQFDICVLFTHGTGAGDVCVVPDGYQDADKTQGKSAEVKPEDIKKIGWTFNHTDVLILSGCFTGKEGKLPCAFVEQGVQLCIAPQILASDAFTAAFAEKFLSKLLDGATVKDAIDEACQAEDPESKEEDKTPFFNEAAKCENLFVKLAEGLTPETTVYDFKEMKLKKKE